MQSANPPFNGIELDHSDSGREGCTVSTLTITAEPRHWEGAVKVGVQEVGPLTLNFVGFLSCKLILVVDDLCSQSGVNLTSGIMHTLLIGQPFCKVLSTVLIL